MNMECYIYWYKVQEVQIELECVAVKKSGWDSEQNCWLVVDAYLEDLVGSLDANSNPNPNPLKFWP